MPSAEFYLAVLPLVHISKNPPFGITEETLTLFPDKNFATEFLPDEVDGYVETFRNRAGKYLTGGRVTGYEFEKIPTQNGLVIVRVVQNVL